MPNLIISDSENFMLKGRGILVSGFYSTLISSRESGWSNIIIYLNPAKPEFFFKFYFSFQCINPCLSWKNIKSFFFIKLFQSETTGTIRYCQALTQSFLHDTFIFQNFGFTVAKIFLLKTDCIFVPLKLFYLNLR